MKRNKLMALTALLTLLGVPCAPSSKAQEVKGDSKQPTSSQSASKDSKATDKTKEQTKVSNKDGKKEQDKGSKKDDKKQQTKNSNPADSKKVLENRVTTLGYTWEQIKKNWPWLVAIVGTDAVSGVVGNQMGKKANVDAKVQQTIQQKITNKELVEAADIETRARELAGGKKYTEADLANEQFLSEHNLITKQRSNDLIGSASKSITDNFNQKIQNGELLTKENVEANYMKKADVDAKVQEKVQEVVSNDYMKKTDVDTKVENLINDQIKDGKLLTEEFVKENYTANSYIQSRYANKSDEDDVKVAAAVFGIKYTDKELNDKVNKAINTKITNKELVKADDQDAIKKAAAVFGIRHTDEELKQKINAAVSKAESTNLLQRAVNESKKKPFDSYVAKLDERLRNSLQLIQSKLRGSLRSTLCDMGYNDYENYVPDDKIVVALNVIADIKNALVDKQAVNFGAKIQNSDKTTDQAWSDFTFKLGSKEYEVYIDHTENENICVKVDGDKYFIKINDNDDDDDDDND